METKVARQRDARCCSLEMNLLSLVAMTTDSAHSHVGGLTVVGFNLQF